MMLKNQALLPIPASPIRAGSVQAWCQGSGIRPTTASQTASSV